MKPLKLLLAAILILNLSSCGFSRIEQGAINIKFNNVNIIGDNRLSYILKNNILLIANKNSNKIFNLEINLTSKKESIIKETTGKTLRYKLVLNANLYMTDINSTNAFDRFFSVSSYYSVSDEHSKTIRNEKTSIEANINKLSEEIIKYLQIINLN